MVLHQEVPKGWRQLINIFERLGISEFINLVTCSDNYSPSIYPRSHSGNDDDFIQHGCLRNQHLMDYDFRFLKVQDLWLVMRNQYDEVIIFGHVELQNEHIDVNVNLTRSECRNWRIFIRENFICGFII